MLLNLINERIVILDSFYGSSIYLHYFTILSFVFIDIFFRRTFKIISREFKRVRPKLVKWEEGLKAVFYENVEYKDNSQPIKNQSKPIYIVGTMMQ